MRNFSVLWSQLNSLDKVKFFMVLLLSFCATLAEVLSVGALFPLLEVALGDKNEVTSGVNGVLSNLISDMNFSELIYIFVVLLVCSYSLRFLYLWAQNSYSYGLGEKICEKVFLGISHSSYTEVSGKNSDFYVTSVTVKLAALVEGLIVPVMSVLSSLLMLIVIACSVVYAGGVVSLLAIFAIVAIYSLIMLFFKTALQRLSWVVNNGYEHMAQFALAAKTGFREWKLLQAEGFLFKKFSKVCHATLQAHSRSRIISSSPRLIVEPLLIIIGLIVIFYRGGPNALVEFLPIIAVAAFALQRFMPYVQAAFAGWTYIRANEASVTDLLSQSVRNVCPIINKSSVHRDNYEQDADGSVFLDCVSFRYQKGNNVLDGFNLEVIKGQSLGIVGASGSGKSTLINLILGFLIPQSGNVYPGNKSQGELAVGYVPQDIFILDGTVRDNVALGRDKETVDHDWLDEVLDTVELSKWLGSLDSGLESELRSDGNGLSGGQRQRIGLARALYLKPKILILDEATSALDNATEKAVLDKVFEHTRSKGITVIFVTHREAPLSYCDRKISL